MIYRPDFLRTVSRADLGENSFGLMLDRQPGVDYASWPERCGTWLCAGFFAINLQQKTKRHAYEYKNGEIIIIGGRADLGFNIFVAGGGFPWRGTQERGWR